MSAVEDLGRQGSENLIEDDVGVGEHFVVGAVLNWMRREDTRDRGEAECLGLGFSCVDELVGSDKHRRDATEFEIVDVVHTARRATASIR
jgi:hypothetical protein